MDETFPPPPVLRIIPHYLLLLAVGWLDCITGREMHLGSLYLLVVALASWNLGLRALIFYTFATAATWSAADWLSGMHYSRAWFAYWNACNHLGVVTITAVLVFKARTTLDRQQRLIRDLGQTLLKINQFKELVPVCRLCHHLHLDDGYRARLNELIDEGVDMGSVGDICPACLDARAAHVARVPVAAYFQAPAGD